LLDRLAHRLVHGRPDPWLNRRANRLLDVRARRLFDRRAHGRLDRARRLLD
jgi:hypothetical protein